MNKLIKIFLTFSSVSLFLIVYLFQNDIIIFENLLGSFYWVMYIIYFFFPAILTMISLYLCSKLSTDSLNKVSSIETSNNNFLASYLAFFFVALSINNTITFGVVFLIIFIFTYCSRVSYFNPIFLIFGYHFFYIRTNNNVKLMLISRTKLKDPSSVGRMEVRRINDYTYIEK